MSLKDALQRLAESVSDDEVRNKLNVANSQTQQKIYPLAEIVGINTSARSAVVKYPGGSTETVALGGTAPLGIGTVVRISGGKII